MYITASSTISHQETFRKKGFSTSLLELNRTSTLQCPDYTTYIPAIDRRRMSDVVKMAIACSLDCIEQVGALQPEAIIVGTAMGCSQQTKNFMNTIINAKDGPLSPTSFILSTHNTIAAQISFILKNNNYNITHTQNSLSFEQALIDAMLCINDENGNVLVGAADEAESDLYNLNARLNFKDSHTTCGASFFMLSSNKINSNISLNDVGSFGRINDISETIIDFVRTNGFAMQDIDLILFSHSVQSTIDELRIVFEERKLIDYQKLSGTYFTNSAFAMSYAFDILSQKEHPDFKTSCDRILICNNLVPENLGLILLSIQNN